MSTFRGKYQGIFGVALAFGYGIGPLVGGVLSEKVSWRVRYYILFFRTLFFLISISIVVLLDYDTNLLVCHCRRHVHSTAQECRRRYPQVRRSTCSPASLSEYHYRKLLAIDYVGTALVLSGCTLIMLPLVWVGRLNSKMTTFIRTNARFAREVSRSPGALQ